MYTNAFFRKMVQLDMIDVNNRKKTATFIFASILFEHC